MRKAADFTSDLTIDFKSYLKFMRDNSYVFNTEESILKEFDRFIISEQIDCTSITEEEVERFAFKNKNASSEQYRRRYAIIRNFLNWLSLKKSTPLIEALPKGPEKARRIPYWFSKEEIQSMIKLAGQIILNTAPQVEQ